MTGSASSALAELLRSRHLQRAQAPLERSEPVRWCLGEIAGRLVEISGAASGDSAVLTVSVGLVLEAQQAREPVAWILCGGSSFYAPDLAESGVELESLAVVRVHEEQQALRAADQLLRSGAFGLVLVDLARAGTTQLSLQAQTRLAGLAKSHDSALVCLTRRPDRDDDDASSLGSLVTLHVRARRRPLAASGPVGGRYICEVQVLKDKRRGPGWSHSEICRGPPGLC